MVWCKADVAHDYMSYVMPQGVRQDLGNNVIKRSITWQGFEDGLVQDAFDYTVSSGGTAREAAAATINALKFASLVGRFVNLSEYHRSDQFFLCSIEGLKY